MSSEPIHKLVSADSAASVVTTDPVHFGRFELIKKISSGGMGDIFLATVRGPYAFEKKFILKLMKDHLADDPKHLKLFAREARVGADLHHPNIAQIYDFGSIRGRYFIMMEYVEGQSLSRLAKQLLGRSDDFRKLRFELSAFIVAEIAKALHFMHHYKGPAVDNAGDLVHRDVSPENILISLRGEVKLSDFGLVKYEGAEDLTGNGKVRGKLAYMAPERVVGKSADAKADQFSLGMVLHELLVGRRYFYPEMERADLLDQLIGRPITPPRNFTDDIPRELDAVVRRATALESLDRFSDLSQMENKLRDYLYKVAPGVDFAGLLGELLHITVKPDQFAKVPARDIANSTLPSKLPISLESAIKIDDKAITAERVVARYQGFWRRAGYLLNRILRSLRPASKISQS